MSTQPQHHPLLHQNGQSGKLSDLADVALREAHTRRASYDSSRPHSDTGVGREAQSRAPTSPARRGWTYPTASASPPRGRSMESTRAPHPYLPVPATAPNASTRSSSIPTTSAPETSSAPPHHPLAGLNFASYPHMTLAEWEYQATAVLRSRPVPQTPPLTADLKPAIASRAASLDRERTSPRSRRGSSHTSSATLKRDYGSGDREQDASDSEDGWSAEDSETERGGSQSTNCDSSQHDPVRSSRRAPAKSEPASEDGILDNDKPYKRSYRRDHDKRREQNKRSQKKYRERVKTRAAVKDQRLEELLEFNWSLQRKLKDVQERYDLSKRAKATLEGKVEELERRNEELEAIALGRHGCGVGVKRKLSAGTTEACEEERRTKNFKSLMMGNGDLAPLDKDHENGSVGGLRMSEGSMLLSDHDASQVSEAVMASQ